MYYTPEQLQKIVSQVRQDIDSFCLRHFEQERRTHLGASEIGEECLRRLWYQWRWIKKKQFNARMLRLFNRGHKEEARFIDWLTGAGWIVRTINPETGKQFLFSEWEGHYGGSTDSLATHPVYFPQEDLICEFKTHNKKYFNALVKNGLRIEQPKHYAQMCNYGAKFGLRLGIYCATNKDNDELHIEIVELDHKLAEHMSETARYIITSQIPPPRIKNANPSFYQCKNCESLSVCFYKEPPDKNCRSCRFASPAPNAQWHCERWQGMIPPEFIPVGCRDYQPIA